jgi:hypothetical protein
MNNFYFGHMLIQYNVNNILHTSHIVSWNCYKRYSFCEQNYHHFVKWRNNPNRSCTSWEVMKHCSLQLFELTTFTALRRSCCLCKAQCWRVLYIARQHCAISAGRWQLRPLALCHGHYAGGCLLCPPVCYFSCVSRNQFWPSGMSNKLMNLFNMK